MTQPINLSVNLNKVALLRNQRDVCYPSVSAAARSALDAGAQGVTVHPRPDERHTRRSDVYELAALVAGDYGGRPEFNVEGYPDQAFLDLVAEVRPDQATLVPDMPDARTSDHGWELPREAGILAPAIDRLKAGGIRISLFMDPEPAKLPLAREIGADRVELYTGPYAASRGTPEAEAVLARYRDCGEAADQAGLGLNAGHDLTLDNLPALCRALPLLAEVSIGHALISDALWMGLDGAVKAYLEVLRAARGA
ncbi:MAG: pyridoxine 5'-phosphate synthase [Kiloniellales bacterium]